MLPLSAQLKDFNSFLVSEVSKLAGPEIHQ